MFKPSHLAEIRAWLGIEDNTTSHSEKLLSALGALLALLVVFALSHWMLEDAAGKALVITSMGASAVLLFAVPHGALSQPWAVLGGHLLSATIGVSCAQLLGQQALAGALAVSLSVGLMYYLRCIHPPGGATALAGVIGGPEITSLGYHFLLTPVLVNVLLILAVALLFNNVFAWRRYPAHWAHRQRPHQLQPGDPLPQLTQEDFAAAITELDSYVDITAEGLTELLEVASRHALAHTRHPDEILSDQCYSNGRLGNLWSVRQVTGIRTSKDDPAAGQRLSYRVVAGHGTGETGICSLADFRQWALFPVVCHQGHWIKAGQTSSGDKPDALQERPANSA